MTTVTKAFAIPGELTEHTPFDKLHFWTWALEQPRADVDVFKYLDALGFVVGRDVISEDQYKVLDYASEAFHRIAPHMKGERSLSSLFTLTTDPKGFYVMGLKGRYNIAPDIVQALGDAGWIYDVTNGTTCFEIIKGRLFARYQQIIGSRCLVNIDAMGPQQ